MSKKREYTDELYSSLDYSTAEFDKIVLLIATGALTISMGFIEKIVPLATAKDKNVLTDAWFYFGLTILIALLNHFLSTLAITHVIKKYDPEVKETHQKIRRRYNYFIRGFNFLSIAFIITGIFTLLHFINININSIK